MIFSSPNTRSTDSAPLAPVKFRRCRCGKCSGCRENARWEQIYEARYGATERAYYSQPASVPVGGVSARGLSAASIYACTDER